MANNYAVLDGNGAPLTKASTDVGAGVQADQVDLVRVGGSAVALGQALAAASLPVVLTAAQVTTLTPPAAITGFSTEATLSTLNGKMTACNTGAVVLAAAENHVGIVGGQTSVPSATFTRPADTTAYAVGDLVANNTTAASVVPLSWAAARVTGGSGMVRRARVKKSTTTTTNASFRLHLYGADPSASTGITNGDNGAWLTKEASYLGALDVTCDKAFSDAADGNGAPNTGSEINFALASGTTVYGLLEARAAYSPGNAEVFTVYLEVLQN